MSCNRNDIVHSPGWYNGEVVVYLTDEDIDTMEAIITGAEGAAMVYEGLAARGIISASLPTGIGLIIGGVLLASYAWIKLSNSGCGVKVHFYLLPGGAGAVYVESQ